VVIPERGEIWWADLGDARGSQPAYHRPVLIIQGDEYNRSQIATVIILTFTSNVHLQDWPGNVFVSASESGLPKNSVINVTQMTINKEDLDERVGRLPTLLFEQVEYGMGMVMGF
jgi:mRNA interferase MazF